MNSITDTDEMYLTSKEAIESTKPNGCSTKKEICEAFAISPKTLELLMSGKLKKVKLTRESVHYDEDDVVTDLRNAIKDFIKVEISLGADIKSIKLALKNVTSEAFDDLDKEGKNTIAV